MVLWASSRAVHPYPVWEDIYKSDPNLKKQFDLLTAGLDSLDRPRAQRAIFGFTANHRLAPIKVDFLAQRSNYIFSNLDEFDTIYILLPSPHLSPHYSSFGL